MENQNVVVIIKVLIYFIFTLIISKISGIVTFNLLNSSVDKLFEDKNKHTIDDLDESEMCRFDSAYDILKNFMSIIIDIIGFILIANIW